MASFGLDDVASAEGELHFDREMHVAYFKSCLRKGFPHQYTSMDTQRMTAVYFSLSALDMLGEVDSLDKAKLIDFVYSWQLEPRSPAHGGFVGTSSMGNPLGGCLCCVRGDAGYAGSGEKGGVPGDCCIMKGHLAMAYTSLASLIILGDASLSRVDRPALVAQVRALQQADGSFAASGDEAGECDLRFVYCACVVSHLLGDWSGVDKSAALRFVLSCVTYEGGLALRPGSEAHGGSCYCGVASIMLMGLVDEAEQQLPGFRRGVQVSVHGHIDTSSTLRPLYFPLQHPTNTNTPAICLIPTNPSSHLSSPTRNSASGGRWAATRGAPTSPPIVATPSGTALRCEC